MAYDGKPSTWIPGWTEDGTDITVPIASLPGLTAAEADGTTGDVRNCLLAILDQAVTHYNSLANADKPTKMSATKNVTYNSSTGLYSIGFNLSFVCSAGDVNVVPEA